MRGYFENSEKFSGISGKEGWGNKQEKVGQNSFYVKQVFGRKGRKQVNRRT